MTRFQLDFEGALTTFAVDQQRRTVTGLIVPWGEVAKSGGKFWGFARGGLKTGDLRRVKLLRDHDNSQVLGYCVAITETELGIEGTFSVAPGPEGDRALALAEHGTLDGLSMGAEWNENDIVPYPGRPGAYLVQTYSMKETSLTGMPAFESSRLTSVRATEETEESGMPEETTGTATPAQPAAAPATPAAPAAVETPAAPAAATYSTAPAQAGATFTMDDVTKLFAAFNAGKPTVAENGIVAPAAPPAAPEARPTINPTTQEVTTAAFVAEPLPYRFSYQRPSNGQPGRHVFHAADYDMSTDLYNVIENKLHGVDREAAVKRFNGLVKATFDVDTTDTAGLTPNIQRPDMWVPQMDYPTPLWDMINAGTLADGTPFTLPKFNSASGLVAAATEGTEPAPGAFTVTNQTITPTQLWGKVEITRQTVRRGGNPQTTGVIWDQMLRSYMEAREAAVATFLNTLTAATDITLTVATGASDATEDRATVASLEAALAVLQFARGGNRFSAFAVQQDLFALLARVADTAGRPLYPIIGPMNANGTTQRLYSTIDIAGTIAVPAYALGAGGQTNPTNSWLFDPAKVRGWASAPERLEWDFGATVQSSNVTQLALVTIGIYGDVALGNVDINGVRQVIHDPVGS